MLPSGLHLSEPVPEEIAASAEDDFVGGNRPVVGEEVDVEEVTALAEVVEHARIEESTAETATVVADLETKCRFAINSIHKVYQNLS